jgi:rhodanese-related sulfurtransferase
MNRLSAAMVAAALLASPAVAESPVVTAMQEYMEFSTYEAGIIVPQQLSKDIFDSVVFIDTRDAGQFAKGSIPGARNIEWREVLSRINDIPKDKKVILFCNTGSLSAQAAFALRVAGRDNVLVLQTGLDGWKRDAAYKP